MSELIVPQNGGCIHSKKSLSISYNRVTPHIVLVFKAQGSYSATQVLTMSNDNDIDECDYK